MEHKSDGDSNCKRYTQYSHQRIDKDTGELRNKRTSEDHPNYSIVEISQNTKKSPRDLRFAFTLTPQENHQLALVWKTQKSKIIILEFFTSPLADGLSLSLSDCKSPQVSRTLLSILADLSNAIVWMVSSLITRSSSLCTNPLVIVPSAPITSGIIVTFIFHSFFLIPLQSWGTYPSFRFLSILLCGQPKQQSPQFSKFSFFCW